MAEYIERETLKERIFRRVNNELIRSWLCRIIDELSSADVAPVRHGRWKCHGDCGVTECSACGWSIEEYVGDYAYCPNCGAKMDEVSE